MSNFFRFLMSHTTTLVFLLLEALAAMLVLTCNDYHRASYITSANVVTGSVFRLTSSIGRYFGLAKANEALVSKNLALQEEVALLRAQLDAVPDSVIDALPLSARPDLRYRLAHVVGASTNRSRNMLTLDQGAEDGIRQDMAVVNSEGVVGLVAAVSSRFALVLPIINTSSHLSVKVKGVNYRGQLVWDGLSCREAQVTDIPEHARVEIGDTVVTSGASTFFPEGMMVGTISSIEPDRNGGFYDIGVELAVDFNSVYDVEVVEDLTAAERQNLEKSVENE